MGKRHPPLLATEPGSCVSGLVVATQEQGVYVSGNRVYVTGTPKLAQWVLTQFLGPTSSTYMEESREVMLGSLLYRVSSNAAQYIGQEGKFVPVQNQFG